MKWFHRKKIIKELIERRNEVISRALTSIPPEMLNRHFLEYKYWLIEPHIKKKYEKYAEVEAKESDRRVQQTIYKILEGAANEESRSGEGTKET